MNENKNNIGSSDIKKKTDVIVVKDELAILEGEDRTYKIGGQVLKQKPLVLRDFSDIFEHIIELFGILIATNPELASGEIDFEKEALKPEMIIRIAHSSKTSLDKLYEVTAIILRCDKDWLIDSCKPKDFLKVIADFFELNDLQDIFQNFQILARRIRNK